VIAGLLVLTLTALTTAGIAVRNAANASHQHAIALSRQLAAESLNIDGTDPVTARRLAVAAWAVFPTGQAASAISTLLARQQQQGMLPADPSTVSAVAFSPGGTLLASADADGTVRRWNPATGRPVGAPLRASTRPVSAVAFSRDGTLLASAGEGRPPSGGGTRPPAAPSARPSAPAPGRCPRWRSAATARLLASAGEDGTVRLWNPATGRPTGPHIHAASAQYGVSAVAFSPDGTLLATAGEDNTVRLWDPATGRPVRAPLPASAQYGVSAVAFSRDGKRLATAGGDGTVRLVGPGHRPAPSARPCPPAHSTACPRWRSAPTASGWPAPAPTVRCGYGTRPPAAPSARRSWPIQRRGERRLRGGVQPRRHGAGQRRRRRHRQAVGPGHRPPGRRAVPERLQAPLAAYSGWCLTRMASCWPAPMSMARWGYGTWPTAAGLARPSRPLRP